MAFKVSTKINLPKEHFNILTIHLQFLLFAAFVAVASASFEGPALEYGLPAPVVAPAVEYGAPAVEYAAPALEYGVPALPAPIARTVIPAPAPIPIAAPSPAHYDFGYTVSDALTGDHKSRHESRRGDLVTGSYSLIDADGTRRVVDYNAGVHGFNAVVRKEPIAIPAPIAPIAPVVEEARIAPIALERTIGLPEIVAPATTYGAPALEYGAPALTYGPPALF